MTVIRSRDELKQKSISSERLRFLEIRAVMRLFSDLISSFDMCYRDMVLFGDKIHSVS